MTRPMPQLLNVRFARPWSPRDELHLQVASMSDVTLIYNTSLLPAQLMLVNFLDAVQLNFVVRGARLAEPTDDAELASALTNTSKGRALDINVQFQAFPAQVDEVCTAQLSSLQ